MPASTLALPALRPSTEADTEALAELWRTCWQDAHAGILPHAIARQRTLESFRARIIENQGAITVAGTPGAPSGFHWTKGAELYQLYVAKPARGAGLAAQLIGDAEKQIAARGARTAWLACAIGNDRAARFYEKSGWRRTRIETIELDLPLGVTTLDVWRYEKDMTH